MQSRRSQDGASAPEVIADDVEKVIENDRRLEAPEVTQVDSPLYFMYHHEDPANGLQVAPSPRESKQEHSKRTRGFGRRNVWLLAVVALTLFASALGGGVGGSLARKNSEGAPAAVNPAPATSPTSRYAASSARNPKVRGVVMTSI